MATCSNKESGQANLHDNFLRCCEQDLRRREEGESKKTVTAFSKTSRTNEYGETEVDETTTQDDIDAETEVDGTTVDMVTTNYSSMY